MSFRKWDFVRYLTYVAFSKNKNYHFHTIICCTNKNFLIVKTMRQIIYANLINYKTTLRPNICPQNSKKIVTPKIVKN